MFDQNLIVGLVVLGVVVLAVYAYAPKLTRMLSGMGSEGFANHNGKKYGEGFANNMIDPKARNGGMGANKSDTEGPMAHANAHAMRNPTTTGGEGFSDFANVDSEMGPVPMAASQKPQGCYPREQLNPLELLPSDPNSQWAQVNPQGAGDIQGKNFLSAGALIGINTIGQSLRNANLQLRAEPPCPQISVSPWMNSTIEPDLIRKPLE
jgi:hypothetical protein